MDQEAHPVAPADQLAIEDALLRFAAGADEGDAELIRSAFLPDACIDFGPCGAKLGLSFASLQGRDAIVSFLSGTGRRQVTSHAVTNARVHAEGKGTTLSALVDTTHLVRDDPSRRIRMMNRYVAEVRADADGAWRIGGLVIDGVWFDGDPSVMLEREA